MKWRGEIPLGPNVEPPTLPVKKVKRIETPQTVDDAHAAAEIDQIGAASHADVLAMVHHLPGRLVRVGCGSSPKGLSGFKKLHLKSLFPQSGGSGHASQSATDDGDARGAVHRLIWAVAGSDKPARIISRRQ
jgi:hypothetical protein